MANTGDFITTELFWNVVIAVCAVAGTVATMITLIRSMFADLKKDLDNKFEQVDKRFSKIEADLKEIRTDVNHLYVQLGKLETRVEEMTLRVIHTTKEGVN